VTDAPFGANPGGMDLALIWLHVSGNLVWIGAILAVGAILSGGQAGSDRAARGRIAYDIYRRLAVPAFIVSFLGGAIRLALDPKYYLKDHHWMHAKLPLALGVIALHHVIGARARRASAADAAGNMSAGSVQEPGPAGILTVVLGVAAVGAAFFAIFKIPG
jgi:putative membrane protein